MWILESNRRALTDLLLANAPTGIDSFRVVSEQSLPSLHADAVYLVWKSNPSNKTILPYVIVVANGQSRDFLAWASTYFASYRPITAYFRIIEYDSFCQLAFKEPSPSLEGIETACIGLIIAEALRLSLSSGKSNPLTPAQCSSMISYALIRALAIGAKPDKIDNLRDRLLLARKLIGQADRTDDAMAMVEICRILDLLQARLQTNERFYSHENNLSALLDACWEITQMGRISDGLWHTIVGGTDELREAHRLMESTRENRVRSFQSVTASRQLDFLPKTLGAFVTGYLASLIGPGSLSYMKLLLDQTPSLPTAPLWYGLFGGLHKKNEILSFSNGIGRRILRELLRIETLMSRPSSDIALTELQILLEGKDSVTEFPRFASNRIIVELEPFVTVYLQWPKTETGVVEEKKKGTLFPEHYDSTYPNRLLEDLEDYLQKALWIQQQLIDNRAFHPKEEKVGWRRKKKKN